MVLLVKICRIKINNFKHDDFKCIRIQDREPPRKQA